MERHRFAPHKAPLASMSRLSTPNTSCECVCTIEQRALTVIVFAVPRRVGVGRRERLKPSLPRFHLGDSGPVIVRLRRRRRRVGGGRMRRHRSEQRALGTYVEYQDAKKPRVLPFRSSSCLPFLVIDYAFQRKQIVSDHQFQLGSFLRGLHGPFDAARAFVCAHVWVWAATRWIRRVPAAHAPHEPTARPAPSAAPAALCS